MTQKNFLLGLHSTSDSLGIGLMDLRDSKIVENLTFQTGRELSNKIFNCINEILPFNNWQTIARLAVATGPGSFTSTRISIVLCRTIAQQLNCNLDGISSFALMAKRLLKEKRNSDINKPFWIINSLKRRGLIGGKYQIQTNSSIPYCNQVLEVTPPHLLKEEIKVGKALEYSENVYLDTLELLKISLSANQIGKESSWDSVLPIYPTSPIDNVKK